jgi:CRP-like cAMP-binding protein
MSIEDDVSLLGSVPSLRLLGAEAVRILAIGAESRPLDRDEVLFRIGDKSDAGYVVQFGRIRLSDAGKAESFAKAGSLIGELALLLDMKRPSTAVATEASSVLRISRSLFQRVLEGHPDGAQRLRDDLAQRTTQATQALRAAVLRRD